MRKTMMSFLAVSLVFCFAAPLWGARKGGGDNKSSYKSSYRSSRDDDRSVRPRDRKEQWDPWRMLRWGFFGVPGGPINRENRIRVGDPPGGGYGRVGRFTYDMRQIRCGEELKNHPVLCRKARLNLERLEQKRNYCKRVVDNNDKVLVPVRDMFQTGVPPSRWTTLYDRRTGTKFAVVDRNYAKRWLGDSFDDYRSEKIKNDFYLGYTGRDYAWRRNVRGSERGSLEQLDREIAYIKAYLEECCSNGLLGQTPG